MRIAKQPDLSNLSTEELEAAADRILVRRCAGRKFASEYPYLTERQLARRRSREIPLYGALLESIICNNVPA